MRVTASRVESSRSSPSVGACDGGYTGRVTHWALRSTSLIVLAMLSGAPAISTACTAMCEAAPRSAAPDTEHGASDDARSEECHESAVAPQVRVGALAQDHCDTHPLVLRSAIGAVTVGRASSTTFGTALALCTTAGVREAVVSIDGESCYSPPGHSSAPIRTSLVLRI